MDSQHNIIKELTSIQCNDWSKIPLLTPQFIDHICFSIVIILSLEPIHIEDFSFITSAYQCGCLLSLTELNMRASHYSSSIWFLYLHSIVCFPRNSSNINHLWLLNLSSLIWFISYSGVPEQNLAIFTDTNELMVYISTISQQIIVLFPIKLNS